MKCPSCSSPMEPNARFCGVCGHRLDGPQGLAKAPPVSTLIAPGGGPGLAGIANPKIAAAQAKAMASKAAIPAAPAPAAATPPLSAPAKAKLGAPRARTATDGMIGEVLNGRFKIESKIGEGGFGAVYRGVQVATGRKVALKLLHPEMTNDENLVARFRREGQVLCNLRDAHSITTYDFDQTPNGTLYIAMELLEGRSLHAVFHAEAPIEWRRMFKIMTEMCSSLAEAHAQGIVHRDLKPENIYLEPRPGNAEFVKILDFGIAKVMRGDNSMDPQAPQLTATGQTLGTLEYMSPEQLMGKPLDGRSDVYALGVLGYELMTGQLPFPDAKGPAGLITAQLKHTPKAPSTVKPLLGIPPAADAVILKCLEKDKNNRYADVAQLSAALTEVLGEGVAVARTQTGSSEPAIAPPPAPAPPPPAPPPSAAPPGASMPSLGTPVTAAPSAAWASGRAPTAPPGDRRWLWWVIGLVVVGAAVGTIVGFAL